MTQDIATIGLFVALILFQLDHLIAVEHKEASFWYAMSITAIVIQCFAE